MDLGVPVLCGGGLTSVRTTHAKRLDQKGKVHMPKPARVQTTEPSGLQGQFLQMQFLTEIRMSIGCGGRGANGKELAFKFPNRT